MRAFIVSLVAITIALTPALGVAQQPISAEAEATALREMAGAIPLGTRVKVHTRQGRRLSATLMSVTSDAIVVKRDSRLPEPALTIPFADLAQLQREEKSGFTAAKAIGIGLAAGVGAILTLFGIAVAISD